MLRRFVEEQRERERTGFFLNHRVAAPQDTVDYEALNRRKQTLNSLPAYQRPLEEGKSDGRSARISHNESEEWAKFQAIKDHQVGGDHVSCR
jgi:hypothetical protein